MPSLKKLSASPVFQRVHKIGLRLGHVLKGVAQDFWKDGGHSKSAHKRSSLRSHPKAAVLTISTDKDGCWHAEPGEVSERMWGPSFVTPADEYMSNLLIKPLNISSTMAVLDLAAGLGGRLRQIADDYGAHGEGREPDPEIAMRAASILAAGGEKHIAIKAYDPMSLVETQKYDCVFARETIYRAPDKEKLIKAIVGCCKPQAQVSFTDYIVNPEMQTHPAMAAWRAFEKDAAPVGLVEMAELWAKAGISLRAHEDQTDYYKTEIKKGLARFATFMASGVKPDAATKKAIANRIATWAHRMAAIDAGMKLYRFYGMR